MKKSYLLIGIILFLSTALFAQGNIYKHEVVEAKENGKVLSSTNVGGTLVSYTGGGFVVKKFKISVNGGNTKLSNIFWNSTDVTMMGGTGVWQGYTQTRTGSGQWHVAWNNKGNKKWIAYVSPGSRSWNKFYYN